ncbi:hypothetical protein OO015_10245 [Thermomicrobium sp. 4228-Ro]|uniref:hypothetical protein n=1 Tax=Thermomicrobium sp. 4228-Ro TaxID=2993937 RepID=UPI002249050F|nr:hypothetical protein [Thermomicrobium sp. 4228-Ro]MCX2727867.1 hypothetical protein [Thermomicrobium sp. 4228-Ro]
MRERSESAQHWFTVLEGAARARLGSERADHLVDELRLMAETIARVFAEPLEFDDEPPVDMLSERPGNP